MKDFQEEVTGVAKEIKRQYERGIRNLTAS